MPEDGYYAKDGQLKLLAEKSGIEFYSLIDENIQDLFEDFSDEIDDGDDEGDGDVDGENDTGGDSIPETFESNLKRNIIYFGAPGTGKSYNLNQDKEKLI